MPPNPFSYGHLRVLVYDANPEFRAVLRGILKAFGICNLRSTETLADAITLTKILQPDVAIVHLSAQPEIEAFIMAVRAGETKAAADLPVIGYAHAPNRDLVLRARNLGVTHFLALPFSAATVKARLDYVVSRKGKASAEGRPVVKARV